MFWCDSKLSDTITVAKLSEICFARLTADNSISPFFFWSLFCNNQGALPKLTLVVASDRHWDTERSKHKTTARAFKHHVNIFCCRFNFDASNFYETFFTFLFFLKRDMMQFRQFLLRLCVRVCACVCVCVCVCVYVCVCARANIDG